MRSNVCVFISSSLVTPIFGAKVRVKTLISFIMANRRKQLYHEAEIMSETRELFCNTTISRESVPPTIPPSPPDCTCYRNQGAVVAA